MLWNKDLVKLLIIRYQENEHLYNARHPLYSDRNKRFNTYLEITKEFKRIKKDITMEEIKKKIHALRSQYIKELNELNSKQSNDVSEDTEPRLWCFNKLKFLKPHLKKSALDVPPSDDVKDVKGRLWNQDTPELYEPVLESSHNERRINLNLEGKVDNVKTLMIARLMERKDYDWLGKQIVFELNALKDESLQRETVWKIQSTLREAYLNDNGSSPEDPCSTVIEY